WGHGVEEMVTWWLLWFDDVGDDVDVVAAGGG
nr:hypothetical protein [Tanacetum cinerariifolium]